jgi:hypothetical protein
MRARFNLRTKLSEGSIGPLAIGASNRGDFGTAPIYIVGGVLFVAGLIMIFGFQTIDVGLIMSGMGLILVGVREKPKLNLQWLKFTGPMGLVPVVIGLLLLMHIIQ